MADDSVVIIGAGLMGAAAAWSLARRGRPVTVLEQFAAGHPFGSSHGSARIVRRAYHDELYTRLTGRAFELWRELDLTSSAADESLLRLLGGLDFGPNRDVSGVAAHLASVGVAHELMPALEAERRWPGMRFDTDVVFHEEAGTLDAERAVRTMLAQAARLGAVVRHETAAASVRVEGPGVRVSCSDGSEVVAGCAVVAAGAWVVGLLEDVVTLPPLRVTQQHVFHFPRRDAAEPPWPTAIHKAQQAAYHLAGGRDGGDADDRKVGVHDGGVPVRPGTAGTISAEARSWVVDYVTQWLPGLEPTPRTETTCLYTETASENFVIDRAGPLVVCSPCSGHGAKFAPLVGEWVADLVTGDGDVPDRFRLAAHLAGLPGRVSL